MEKKHVTKLRRRVRRGARLLDKKVPDWPSRIDPALLDMSSPNSCIVGQTFASSENSYNVGLAQLGIDTLSAGDVTHGFEHGPVCTSGSAAEEYSVLAELWLEEAKERLNTGITL